MDYPTLEEVEIADITQLEEWFKYLQPAASGISYKEPNYIEKYESRISVIKRIVERVDDHQKEENFNFVNEEIQEDK